MDANKVAVGSAVSSESRTAQASRQRGITVLDGGQGDTSRPSQVSPMSLRPVDGVGEQARLALVVSNSDRRDANGLTDSERELVRKLSARDQEVRRHEEAHARVGGEFAGRPSYTYQEGPDGRRYAIGGEVPIDVSPVPDDPEATIVKMTVVKRAALAPAEPSGQDRRVAALADAQRLQAVVELNAERIAEATSRNEDVAEDGGIAVLAEQLRQGEDEGPGQVLSLAA